MKKSKVILTTFICFLVCGIVYAAVTGMLSFDGTATFAQATSDVRLVLVSAPTTSDPQSSAQFILNQNATSATVNVYLDAVNSDATIRFRIQNFSRADVRLDTVTVIDTNNALYDWEQEGCITFSALVNSSPSNLQITSLTGSTLGAAGRLNDRTNEIIIYVKWMADDIDLPDSFTFTVSFGHSLI